MAEQLLSSHWYRIADVKLSLHTHIRMHQHNYRNTVWFVFSDEISGKHHRYNEAAYNFIKLIDGNRSVNDVWQQLQNELGDEAPTQDEVIRLLGTLHFANHLFANITPDIEEIIDRRNKERKQLFKTKFGNPLSLRFPLADPDIFLHKYMPYVAPLFTRTAAIIALIIVLLAALQGVKNWDILSQYAIENSLSPYNLLIMFFVYPVIKAVHELGHGFAVKRWGGEVHELGIMMLVMMPVPYVDASAASSFRSKYKRMFVGAAGIIVELVLASIALLIWTNIGQGIISDILFNVVLIGAVSTVLFNANPLLKFDGYFVFSDALEIPGLAARANRYYGYLINKHVFKVDTYESPVMAEGEVFWFLTYAVSAFVYRLFLMVVIILFVAQQYFFIGIILALWALFMQAVLPVIKWLKYIFASPVLMHKRERSLAITGCVLAGVLAIIFSVPVPLNTVTEGVVWMPEKSHVRASVDGFVTQVLVKSGEQVDVRDPLIATDDPLTEAQLRLLKAQYRELEVKQSALIKKDLVEANIMLEEMELTRAKIARTEEQVSELVMVSSSTGEFVLANSTDLQGYFVKHGEPVAYVINYNDVSIRVVVPQAAIGLVRQSVKHVEIRFVDQMNEVYTSEISREIPAATNRLPSKALGHQGGGRVQTDPFDADGLRTKDQYFQFDIALPDEVDAYHIGKRVFVKFNHGFEPLAFQWYRTFGELFLDNLGKL